MDICSVCGLPLITPRFHEYSSRELSKYNTGPTAFCRSGYSRRAGRRLMPPPNIFKSGAELITATTNSRHRLRFGQFSIAP